MSEGLRSTSDSSFPEGGRGARSAGMHRISRLLVYLALAGALGAIAFATVRVAQDRAYVRETEDHLVALHGLVQASQKHLAPQYSDKAGRLLADPPGDPKQMLDPERLVLAHYIDAEAETQPVDWDGLQARLAEATGKKVVGQEYRNNADDVADIQAAKIHIVALHAADAPHVVNEAGFIPFAVLGTESGAEGNHLDIAVSAESNIQALADIRGHKLTCTRPDSVTGYRAAIVVLLQDAGMRPNVDYTVTWSYRQKDSIVGLAGGSLEVAALSDDKLQSLVKKGSVKQSDYRVIYKSQVIPRLTIGYVYNLKPELAAQITAAVLDFKNEAAPADEDSAKANRFFPVDYKKDFEFVRRMDDCFDPRFGKRPKEKPSAAIETQD